MCSRIFVVVTSIQLIQLNTDSKLSCNRGFLHESMLSPQLKDMINFVCFLRSYYLAERAQR